MIPDLYVSKAQVWPAMGCSSVTKTTWAPYILCYTAPKGFHGTQDVALASAVTPGHGWRWELARWWVGFAWQYHFSTHSARNSAELHSASPACGGMARSRISIAVSANSTFQYKCLARLLLIARYRLLLVPKQIQLNRLRYQAHTTWQIASCTWTRSCWRSCSNPTPKQTHPKPVRICVGRKAWRPRNSWEPCAFFGAAAKMERTMLVFVSWKHFFDNRHGGPLVMLPLVVNLKTFWCF